eukprot:TRINITY_DN2596_c2_g1_i1.p1 TRINITY_DN2596_c2_g1~~TRINITY_DN2596_c2_g1_i1.p1  ORF type:complete len:1730 (+),score=437.43 TRINITY_DN2596_c2_g1_i1:58-5247(+)
MADGSTPPPPPDLPDTVPTFAADAADGSSNKGEAAGDEGQQKKKSKDIQQVGLSVYIRKKIKQEDKEGKAKTKTFWILEGKAYDDKEFVWEERRAKEGHIQYRSAATGKSTRTLPDVGPTKSALGGDGSASLSPKRLKRDPTDGWDADKKAAIQSYIKKKLSKPTKEDLITPEVQKILVKNVADKHMAENPPFTGDSLPADIEKTLSEEAKTALNTWLSEKNEATEKLRAAVDYTDLNFIDQTPLDDEAVLPDKPNREPPAPLSPFVPRANYLRDPYYYMRLDFPNPRRGKLEEDLEARLFFNPSLGEVKVMGAINGWLCHPSDPKQNQQTIIAVIRDWVGACCLAYIQPPGPVSADYSITAIHPLCEHLDMGKLLGKQAGSDSLRGITVVDDQRHVLGFKNQDDHKYLDLLLKLAMCSMYAQGSDDGRVVAMRARSVEFAWNHTQPIAEETAIGKLNMLMTATEEELSTGGDSTRQVDTLVHDIRMYMLGAENRDEVLRKWVASVQRNRDPSTSLILRQLRIVEEAIRYPSPTNDPFLHEGVLQRLSQLQLQLSRADTQESIPWNLHPARLTSLWKTMVPHVQEFKSREAVPDVPFETCFEPAPSSEAAFIQKANIEQRRFNYSQDQLPPGVYLSALVYCGDEILSDAHHNLPCELVKEQYSSMVAKELHRDSDDFKWILQHGSDPEWADDIQTYSQVYDNSGTMRFRALFVEAAKRLQAQLGRQDLGFIFDNVILQKEVQCIQIVTVLRLTEKNDVPIHSPTHVGWGWRPAADVEYTTYLKSFKIRASTRVAFMHDGYNNCQRWIHAAIKYREAMDNALQPGLYLAYFGVCPSSSGFRMMVSETHRFLLPLAKVQTEFPTLEEWRWVQCVNEKKRRVGSFEWHTVSTTIKATSEGPELPTFRHRFLRAVFEMQETVGKDVQHIFDMEVISFDEMGKIKVIAVGERFLDEPPKHTPPLGTTACCFKNFEMVEATYFEQYWQRAWKLFSNARSSADAMQLRICQPFATDEALRLEHEGALSHLAEVESMFLPLRWMWHLWLWVTSGYRSVVEEHEGSIDKSIVRGIEESVEIAVSNCATQQDINYLTMKSIAMDMSRDPSWDTLYTKLREVQRTMKNGYAQRVQQLPGKNEQMSGDRTWDELYSDEGSDDDVNREPTVYNMECTLEELIERDGADGGGAPNTYFDMKGVVEDIVDLALVEAVDANNIRVAGQALSDMITIIEWLDSMVNDAVVLTLKEQAVDVTYEENKSFKKVWYDIFNDGDAAEDAIEPISSDEEDDEAGVYQQGSAYIVNTPEEGVRVCMAKAMNSVSQCEELLKVIASAQEVAELTDSISDYDTAVAKQVSIIKNSLGPGAGAAASVNAPTPTALAGNQSIASLTTPARQSVAIPHKDASILATPNPSHSTRPLRYDTPTDHGATPAAETEFPVTLPAAELVMVSSDYQEFPLKSVDVSRCVALQNAKGSIRFPAVHSSQLAVVAQFMRLQDEQLAGFLRTFDSVLAEQQLDPNEMLGLGVQLKAPLLVARVAGMVYGTPLAGGPDSAGFAYNTDSAKQLWNATEVTFMPFGIHDWLRWSELSGGSVEPTLDVCWWGRYHKETASSQGSLPYVEHEGSWKQMYAESRVKAFLSRGLQAIPSEEIALWNGAFGALVEYISFKDCNIGDDEMEVFTTCCSNVKSLDISLTSCSDLSVGYITTRCPSLIDVNADGANMTPGAVQRLLAFASSNSASVR